VSISPTFYDQLFHTKAFSTAFLYLQVGFVIFWQKNIGEKAARKMLVKLTTGQCLEMALTDETNEKTENKGKIIQKLSYSE